MKLPQIRKKTNWNYTALAFLLPFTLMAVIYFITSVTPFGGSTLLYSDNYHQYYPFFRQFREAIRSGQGLTWTWSVGMGMDYLGMISYYLASPLNLLSVLLPESWTLTYFTWLMPLKLSFASLFFAIMLKKLFGKNDLSLPLFGGFYAMCAWALGYQWNIMWLDTFAMLPLVALGTILLLKERNYLLYTISLTLAVLSNYYIGFFVCIFVFLLFWCYEICRFKSIGRFLADLFFIGVFTLLAIGMTAVLEIPTLASLQTTYSSVNQFPEGFQLNIISAEAQAAAKEAWTAYKTAKEAGQASFTLWLDAIMAGFPVVFAGMQQVAGQIGGGQAPTYMDGLPNLYCGVFPIALGFLFLLSNDVKLRDKLCSTALLVLFMVSFLFRQLDYIWHGFHFTNQIPYRFSFLFSFVVLYMAYRAWLLRNTFPLWKIIAAGLLSIGLLLFGQHDGSDILYWLFNFAFLGLYLLCMIVSHDQYPLLAKALSRPSQPETDAPMQIHLVRQDNLLRRRRIASLAIACSMVLELVLHSILFVSGFSIYDWDYPKNEDNAAALFQKLEDLDDGKDLFYRMEVTHAQTLNDGALNSYNGISTFSSSANVKTTEFMQCLGAGAYNSWNRYCYEESSPVSNLFLNLKYLVERDVETQGNHYFDPILTENGMTVLKNNAYLPLGFLAEPTLAELEFSTTNHSFIFQNNLFKAATGINENVWRDVPSSNATVTTTGDIKTHQANISGYTSFSTGAEGGTMTYTYNITQEGFMCLDVNLYRQKNFTVYHNDKKLYDETYSLAQMLAVTDVKAGDTVKVVITCKPNYDNTSLSIRAAVLKEDVFRRGYERLNRSTLTLTEVDTTCFRGTIHCDRDGLLYTSIPQNGNWKALVDGKEAPITLVGDCMVSIMLSEGDHTVEIFYENEALQLGGRITLICGGLFAAIIVTDQLLRRRKKKA